MRIKLLSPVKSGSRVVFVESLDYQKLVVLLLLHHAVQLTAPDQDVSVSKVPLSVTIANGCYFFIVESALERVWLGESMLIALQKRDERVSQ